MKFEKLNENLFDKQTELTKEEMINSKGGEIWSSGCGKAVYQGEVIDVCEWYNSETETSFYRIVFLNFYK